MPHLGHGDLLAFSRFLLDIHSATGLEGFSRRVASELRRLIPAHRCSYNYLSADGRVAWIADGEDEPTDPERRGAVVAGMRRHPIVVHARRTGDHQRFLRLSDYISRADFHRTPLYNEWYRHCRTEHQLLALFPSERGDVLGVALSRDGRRDFSQRDRALGNALVPHLSAGYRAALRASRVEQEIAQLTQGLEHAKAGVILLTEAGRVRLATVLARVWLRQYFDDAPQQAECLPTPIADWVVHSTRGDAGASIAAEPRHPLVVKGEGRRLVIELLGTPPHCVLVLAEEITEIPAQSLRSLGLTSREAEVLRWVAEGKRDGEVAAILGLSSRTIQHHLERIYRKLGVETRTAAASRAREAVTTRARS